MKLLHLRMVGVSLLFTMEEVSLQSQTWKENWGWGETMPCFQRREERGMQREGSNLPRSTRATRAR